jgi:hypothetical protein
VEGTLAAPPADVLTDDVDRADWLEARRLGRHLFIEERVSRVGAVLGVSLAAWNAIVGGTFGAYHDFGRILLESAYYLGGSMVLSGLAAMLEWSSLERRFDR